MELVLDANVLIAALVKDGLTRKLLFEPDVIYFAPEFIIDEVFKHIDEVSNKVGVKPETIGELLNKIFSRANINVIPFEELKNFVKDAKNIVPDVGDLLYFACALKMKCPVWSNDKRLKNQDRIQIYSTKELIVQFQ